MIPFSNGKIPESQLPVKRYTVKYSNRKNEFTVNLSEVFFTVFNVKENRVFSC